MPAAGNSFARMHVVVVGKVQGVFFRARMQQQARMLGISGWVRNLPDGNVEAIWEGREKDLAALLGWTRQGPPQAAVAEVRVSTETYLGEYDGFQIRYEE